MNLYFPCAGQGLFFFFWWQQHFEFQLACVAVEGRNNVVVLNIHAQLQILLSARFLHLSLLYKASQCAFGDDVRQLLVQQFFSLFAQFKTTVKSHENYVFLYPFSNMAISPKIMKKLFYTHKLYGLTGVQLIDLSFLYSTMLCILADSLRSSGWPSAVDWALHVKNQRTLLCFQWVEQIKLKLKYFWNGVDSNSKKIFSVPAQTSVSKIWILDRYIYMSLSTMTKHICSVVTHAEPRSSQYLPIFLTL